MTEDDAANAFGRIIALEMMTTNFLTIAVGKGTAKPLAALDELKQTMFSSGQNADRPVGEFEDKCWDEAVQALELLFENTHKRLLSLGVQE